VRGYLEPSVEPVFHEDSYGYRPGENDGLHWPRRDGLKWPHLASVVVGVDVD